MRGDSSLSCHLISSVLLTAFSWIPSVSISISLSLLPRLPTASLTLPQCLLPTLAHDTAIFLFLLLLIATPHLRPSPCWPLLALLAISPPSRPPSHCLLKPFHPTRPLAPSPTTPRFDLAVSFRRPLSAPPSPSLPSFLHLRPTISALHPPLSPHIL